MWFYKTFQAKKVLDPFACWGDRCLAALVCNIDYIGIDSNKNLKEPFKRMISFYPHSSKIRFINKSTEKVDTDLLDFDFIFSSPPFWNEKGKLIEKYNHQSVLDREQFVLTILAPLIIRYRKHCWVCFYMPSNMVAMLEDLNIVADEVISYGRMGNKNINNTTFIAIINYKNESYPLQSHSQ